MATPRQRSRPRKYDLAKTTAAVKAQLTNIRTVVAALDEGQFGLPTRLPGWTVRELVAHIALAGAAVVNRNLEQPPAPAQEIIAAQWPEAVTVMVGHADEMARKAAAETEPLTLIDGIAEKFAVLTADAAPDRLLAARSGAMRLDDFLATRCVELAVHTDDLAAALGTEIPCDRHVLATACRVLADALAAQAPGGSVEVRIPPFAVVQCIEGPRHTRGTPPNVVETDARTWLRLATGRTDWAAALDEAAVAASGERADLSAHLPLLR
ncbi:maleylpyruvate isomerase family mycothiol-dependent enzyme [Streptomyces sp. UNOC14_S4]|uniref:maleylpyruvate isomerase family mycothiol-dependent enzyme n=1 Tax=Streptomyces sp. UNOC14_S4 TaxID=2872340 RepID=UPI001E4B888A|nr:maleylpyruvate isomerase family mycothiol-dependent enzyme [Streptomyces sp. UNOC14_S4]MCC3767474.1 maleylpyruvate isomerase family mycothiol-dependent enzyme [Streptomyces sp. UNOC14_S4]